MSEGFYLIISSIVKLNLALAIFNLVPIPPLDGSKIIFPLLPKSLDSIISTIEQYSFIFLIIFIVFFLEYLYPILTFLFHFITGASF